MLQNPNFPGSIPDPAGELTLLPQTPNLWGGAHCSPPPAKNLTLLSAYMKAYMNFIFFRFQRMEKMYSVMKGLMGQCPRPQNFWTRTTPASNILTACDVVT